MLLSGGRDSVCLLGVAVGSARTSAPCTSTTGCGARTPTPTRRTAARCASGSVSRSTSTAPRVPTTPAATSRPGRATSATPRAGASRRSATRVLAAGAHRHRPGRDDPLPARGVARAPRAAGHGAAVRAGSCGRCSTSPARRRRAWCRDHGPDLARGRQQRRRVLRARARTQGLVPALRAVHPRAEAQRPAHRRAPARGGRGARRGRRHGAGAGATAIALGHLADLPPALARLVVRRLAEARPARCAPARPTRLDDILAPGRRRRSTSATAPARSSSTGSCASHGPNADRVRRSLAPDARPADRRDPRPARRARATASARWAPRSPRTTRAATSCWSASSRAPSSSSPTSCATSTCPARSTSWPSPPTARRPTPAASCGSSRTSTADRGPRRPDRRGHRRLRPDAAVPAAQPGRAGPRLARGLRAADQARAAQGRAGDALRRLRDSRPLRHRLRARPRRAVPQPALRGGVDTRVSPSLRIAHEPIRKGALSRRYPDGAWKTPLLG